MSETNVAPFPGTRLIAQSHVWQRDDIVVRTVSHEHENGACQLEVAFFSEDGDHEGLSATDILAVREAGSDHDLGLDHETEELVRSAALSSY